MRSELLTTVSEIYKRQSILIFFPRTFEKIKSGVFKTATTTKSFQISAKSTHTLSNNTQKHTIKFICHTIAIDGFKFL